MLKLLQEIQGFAALANRCPQPLSPALALTPIRAHLLLGLVQKRRLNIRIDPQDPTDIPYQVKINHLRHEPALVAISPAL